MYLDIKCSTEIKLFDGKIIYIKSRGISFLAVQDVTLTYIHVHCVTGACTRNDSAMYNGRLGHVLGMTEAYMGRWGHTWKRALYEGCAGNKLKDVLRMCKR